MADVYLKVPKLNQHQVFPTSSFNANKACWYTSSVMLLLYRSGFGGAVAATQVQTLARLFNNAGLGATEDAKLASELRLEHSPSQHLLPSRTLADYQKALGTFGPLLMSQPTHVIVVTGATRNVAGQETITYNDPWDGLEKTELLQGFNQKIAWNFPIHYRRSRFAPPLVLAPGQNTRAFTTRY